MRNTGCVCLIFLFLSRCSLRYSPFSVLKQYLETMSRLGFVSSKCFTLARQPLFSTVKRTFLSEAYQCRDAWEKRLESPILKKVNVTTLYQEIDLQYSETGSVSSLDADIFINANTKDGFMEDIEDVLIKLRRCPDTSNTFPSTHHGAIRLLLDAGKTEKILHTISDRLKFGVFPDYYCLNLLMDTFLKQGKFAAAARVGVTQMIQEDWSNQLTNCLSMYSCHMFLRNQDQVWYSDEEKTLMTPAPEPKDVVKIRIKFIRNPYFDDHFDLQDPLVLVGKTLWMFCPKINGSEQLTTSYKLLGLTLHQKWDQVMDLAKKLADSKKPIHREAIDIARKSLEPKPQPEESATEASKSAKPAKPDPAKEAKEAALKAELEVKQKVSDVLGGLEASAISEDMLAEVSSLVKEAVKLQESKLIEEQKELYTSWDKERVLALRKHQEEVMKEEALRRIDQQKLELVEKEREIFFFDNQDKLDLMIEKNEEIFKEIEEKEKFTKEIQAAKDAEYIPPDVKKKFQQ
ncbi:28S ribosomal protein S27, mitochondrial-like [Thrips palmi]|uniref:28S ribosomal protein S27, mitochondrial-like n=1 Tax=Thrips palmi TaxID=161013 RepID=A0A6P8YNR5_THRPL|nr:28S ribosomal protein S27, mitochondrial-like [Thrips palmi]